MTFWLIFAVLIINARDESRAHDGTFTSKSLFIKTRLICVAGGRVYGPGTEQDTSSPEKIVTQAYKFLDQNLVTGTLNGFRYSFSKPSSYKYGPSQWLWGTNLLFAMEY
jgi:hypothetical protein